MKRFPSRLFFWLALLASMLALAGCALPEKPVRPALFDFGPGALAPQPATRLAPLPPLALGEIEASGLLDTTAVVYRLGYADENQLRPYAQARWTMSAPQLLRQRLRAVLGQRRAVLNAEEGASQSRREGDLPRTLRIELEEFSHYFDGPTQSRGVIRLRATLVDIGPSGERVLGQRSFIASQPATTADAAGGVRALAAASDAAIEDLSQWLQQLR